MIIISRILFFFIYLNSLYPVYTNPTPSNQDFFEFEKEEGHFIFYAPKELKEWMPQIAQDSEAIYQILSPLLQTNTPEKIRITFTLNTRKFNAYTYSSFQKGIEYLSFLPQNNVSFPGNLKKLIYRTLLHEIVHYLNLSHAKGIFKFLQKVFGNYLSPPSLTWNRFYLEGIF